MTTQRNIRPWICLTLLVPGLACNPRSQERAKQELSEARQETRIAEHSVRKLKRDIRTASERTQTNDMAGAEAKLGHGQAVLQRAGLEAAGKLDRAALLARVKAKLASDVGLSTVSGIDVNIDEQVVTLRGSVSSSQQRARAEEVVKAVPSVSSVVNRLTIEP